MLRVRSTNTNVTFGQSDGILILKASQAFYPWENKKYIGQHFSSSYTVGSSGGCIHPTCHPEAAVSQLHKAWCVAKFWTRLTSVPIGPSSYIPLKLLHGHSSTGYSPSVYSQSKTSHFSSSSFELMLFQLVAPRKQKAWTEDRRGCCAWDECALLSIIHIQNRK